MSPHRDMLDYRDELFVLSCSPNPRVHSQLLLLPGCRSESGVWLIPRRLKSARTLMGLSRRYGWRATRRAQQEIDALRDDADAAEFYVQRVQDFDDSLLFKIRADDDDLESHLASIPGVERDDELNTWIAPMDDRDTSQAVLALVDGDERFHLDRAVYQHLYESGGAFERHTPRPESVRAKPPNVSTRGASDAAQAVAQFDREQEMLSASRSVVADQADAESPLSALLPYQRAGVRYLVKARKAFLADDLGLGAEAQALLTLAHTNAFPALIMCSGAELEWERAVKRWLGGRSSVVVYGTDGTGSIPLADIVIASYDVLSPARHLLVARRFRGVVADESSKLSNEHSLRTRAALAISEHAEVRLCISARALDDRPINLVPQLAFLDRLDDLGGRTNFVERYCAPRHDLNGTRYAAANVAELEQRLRSCCLCRREQRSVAAQLTSLRRSFLLRRSSDEETLACELRLIDAIVADGRSAARVADFRADVQTALRNAARMKVHAVCEWIDSFIAHGELLSVVVDDEVVVERLEDRYKEAVSVRSDGTVLMGGKLMAHPYLAGTATLAIVHSSAVGPAIRMLRGRHVAVAEFALHDRLLQQADALAVDRQGVPASMQWYLVGESPIERAAMAAQETRWSAGELADSYELLLERTLEEHLEDGSRALQPAASRK